MRPSRRRSAVARLTLGFGALAASWIFACALVRAQPYPGPSPVPRTTDPAALRALIAARELHERFARGMTALASGDWNVAESEFSAVLALHPREPQGSTASYDLALAEVGLHRYDRAAELLTEALRLDPRFAAAAANLVSVELFRNDLPAARAAADRFVAIAPEAALARYQRGLIALRAGDATTALGDFGVLLGNNPAYAVAHYDLALAQIESGRFAEAERELRRALSLAPAYARARVALGTLLLRDGQRDEARRAFDQAARDAQDPSLRNLALSLRDRLASP